MRVTSPALEDGGTVPERFTCDGADTAPPLAWAGEPGGTRAFAVVMEDPDAPGGTFVHWTAYGIAPGVHRLPAAGTLEGESSFGDTGYGGPCPPEGDDAHRYRFYVYALRAPLGLQAGASPADVRSAIADAALARGRLVATYGR
jgi:Raf kinase inhibitor-like YbhB/YbcL family protein